MFLNRLNGEQKELFLDICIHAAMANGEFVEEEKTMVQQYCDEMRLDKVRYTAERDYESAANQLIAISSDAEIRMVVVELAALIISDHQFDDFEKEFIRSFIERIHMGLDEFNGIIVVLQEISESYEKVNRFVFG